MESSSQRIKVTYLKFSEEKNRDEAQLAQLYKINEFMGIFQDEDAVFGKMRAGVDTTKHVYMEPDFKNVIQEDKHPIFYVLGVFFIILGIGALMALDYKSIIFLGESYF